MQRLFITAVLLLISSVTSAQTVVVVAKDSNIKSLDYQHVANIFLARTNRLPNGEKAQPLELKENPLREYFYQAISGKSPKQLYAYWTTLVFTGKGKPPLAVSNSGELIQKLQNSPGAITYIAAEHVTDDMQVVFTFP